MLEQEKPDGVDADIESMLSELDELGYGVGDDLDVPLTTEDPVTETPNEGNENEDPATEPETTDSEADTTEDEAKPVTQTVTVDILGEPIAIPVEKFKEMNTPANTPQEELLFMRENDISKEDLALLNDLKRGDKNAIAHLLKEKEIDPELLDEEGAEYTPQFSVDVPDPLDLRIQEVMEDVDLSKQASDVLDLMPDNVSQAMFSNRDIFDTFIETVQDGSAQRVVRSLIQDGIPQHRFGQEFAVRLEKHAQSTHEDPVEREQKAVEATDIGNTTSGDSQTLDYDERFPTDKEFEDEFGSMDDYYI